MEVVTVVVPDAVQPCARCGAMGIQSPIFFTEIRGRLYGDCPHHGLYETEPFDYMDYHEKEFINVYQALMQSIIGGGASMIKTYEDGKTKYILTLQTSEGPITIGELFAPEDRAILR